MGVKIQDQGEVVIALLQFFLLLKFSLNLEMNSFALTDFCNFLL